MSSTFKSESKEPFGALPTAVEIEAVAQVTDHGEIDSTPTPHVPPDGGLHAWLKVLGGFLIYSNIWGFTLSYGAFQTYYQHELLSSSSASSISWIGTVQAWLLILIGVLSGPLFDLGYFRSMLFAGNFLVVLGIMMLSFATRYWHVFLAQGVCMGVGAGLLYIPSLALVGIWFSRKRSLAMGIVTSGIAVGEPYQYSALNGFCSFLFSLSILANELPLQGGVAYIISFNRLTASNGFPWAIRVMGFIALAVSLASFPALLSGSSGLKRPRAARKLVDKTALRDPLFIVFTCSSFTCFLGYIVPYFYIPTYAQDHLGVSAEFALYILVISIAASFFGRLSCGYVAHRFGNTLTWMACAFISGILSLSWISIESENSFIAFSALWGFFSAALVTLPGSCFPNICPDLAVLGTRMGMSWGFSSIATLIGAPIAGALLRMSVAKDGTESINFIGIQIWSGACLLLGSAVLALLWIMTVRKQKKGYFI